MNFGARGISAWPRKTNELAPNQRMEHYAGSAVLHRRGSCTRWHHKMKKTMILSMLLSTSIALAAPPPKLSIVLYDPKSDPNVFESIPTPTTHELQLVTSNHLIWVKSEGALSPRAQVVSTTVYVQKRVGQKPTLIIRFGGRKMSDVVGVSERGSLLFKGGEEFIVSGDASARSSSDASRFFLSDIRHTCIFDIQFVTSPSIFVRRLSEDKNPTFVLPVFKMTDKKTMEEIQVKAIPNDQDPEWNVIKSGDLPSPGWLRNLWPIVEFDEASFTIWNGTEWIKFKWDANQTDPGSIVPHSTFEIAP